MTDTRKVIAARGYQKGRHLVRAADSSVVLVDAPTRFNDDGEPGLGAEIGVGTSKLHAFGPLGVEELTITKLVVYGDERIR